MSAPLIVATVSAEAVVPIISNAALNAAIVSRVPFALEQREIAIKHSSVELNLSIGTSYCSDGVKAFILRACMSLFIKLPSAS
jgi:hypothetical protein